MVGTALETSHERDFMVFLCESLMNCLTTFKRYTFDNLNLTLKTIKPIMLSLPSSNDLQVMNYS